jgi:predicted transcriptional regulator of viral defense system
MPIDIDRFQSAPEETLRADGPTNAERVMSFLAAHSQQAFTPAEIRDATGVPDGSIGVVLSRLEDADHVDHRGEYWAIQDADSAGTTLTALATARAASARFGDEDPAEWGPGVVEDETPD